MIVRGRNGISRRKDVGGEVGKLILVGLGWERGKLSFSKNFGVG